MCLHKFKSRYFLYHLTHRSIHSQLHHPLPTAHALILTPSLSHLRSTKTTPIHTVVFPTPYTRDDSSQLFLLLLLRPSPHPLLSPAVHGDVAADLAAKVEAKRSVGGRTPWPYIHLQVFSGHFVVS